MRLFAAVLPPPAAVAELARAAAELHRLAGAGELRWTARDGWHFTLAFYGEVADADLPRLTRKLARKAADAAPFPLAVAGGGHFGDRALWAGADGDVRALAELARHARYAFPVTAEDRHPRFRPHLTLARSRARGFDFLPYAAALDTFRGATWQVEELALVRSRLPGGGVPGAQPRYEKVGGWPLGAAG